MMMPHCSCVEPDEVCTLLSRNEVVARVEHTCVECGQVIQPGQKYERDATVFEGEFTAHKTCLPCRNMRNHMFSCGWHYGQIWEDLREMMFFDGNDEDDDFEWMV